ncbi:MAG: zinc ribbon domain-containing protein [Conexivisphaerales archaeon]
MPYCPECGKRVNQNDTVCYSCKGNLIVLYRISDSTLCPRCGELIDKSHVFCYKCGYSRALITKGNKQNISPKVKKILPIAGIIILVIFTAFALTNFLVYNPPESKYEVIVNPLHIQYSFLGSITQYAAYYQPASFSSYDVLPGSSFVAMITLPANPAPFNIHILSIIILTAGFTLLSGGYALPYSIAPGTSVTLALVIQAPDHAYNGPVDVLILLG